MIPVQRNKYLETSIQTATPGQLLIMLYDGAIRFCKIGIEGIRNRKYDEASIGLNRAQEIIRELDLTLDRRYPVSENLSQMYDYFLFRLREANVNKEAEHAEEVLQYLIEFRETWAEAIKTANMAVSGTK